MPTLDGTDRAVELAPGVRIVAPGLRGTIDLHEVPPDNPTRATQVDAARPAWEEALASAGALRTRVITLDVTEAPPPGASGVRAPSGEDGLVIELPDLGDTVDQVVAAVDEAGVVTWNFPLTPDGAPATTRGAGSTLRYVIRNTTPPTDEQGTDRGLIGAIGRKVLEVLLFPVVDPVLGPVTRAFAGAWERSKRPVRVRGFLPGDHRSAQAEPLTEEEWRRLGSGPCLLFVHGTFATSHGGFGALPTATMEELHRRYGGRVAAFDHHTLAVDPLANVAALGELIPDGVKLTADVVAHSRGGLVARALAGEGVASPIEVRRGVYVGTPNHGTPLADPAHMVAFLDRVTTMLNFVPDPIGVTDVLEAVLTVVKVIARTGLGALPGLASMDPGGEFLASFNTGAETGVIHHAIAADYEPVGAVRRLVTQLAKDAVVDRVFDDAANDLVVPTVGVYEGSGDPAFPIPEERRLLFAKDVFHGTFFSQPDTSRVLLEWLT